MMDHLNNNRKVIYIRLNLNPTSLHLATYWHVNCDDLAVWIEPVHVPMSLWARTAAQDESISAHVPMSPLGEDRCVEE